MNTAMICQVILYEVTKTKLNVDIYRTEKNAEKRQQQRKGH